MPCYPSLICIPLPYAVPDARSLPYNTSQQLHVVCCRHLPTEIGTGTKALLLLCWHKPTLLQASHASQATLRSCLCLPSSGFRHSPRFPNGGFGDGRFYFTRSYLACSSKAPCHEFTSPFKYNILEIGYK